MNIDLKTLEGKKLWSESPEEVMLILETSKDGLGETIAEQRLEEFGKNSLPRQRRGVKLKILLRQFSSPLIIILMIAGIITVLLQDLKDGVFIFVAVVINATLGFYQENKAENALESLRNYVKEKARVIREGNEKEIDAELLVPGDVIRLTAGTRVPADSRIFLSNNLSVDESILTGESLPVSKGVSAVKESSNIGDRKSMVYSGTLVVGGIGLGVVVSTGLNSELGKIAALLKKKKEEPTPLQKYIKRFSMWIGGVFVFMSALLFALGTFLHYSVLEMFLISVAVAVSAVPEGLPIALTVVLAIGVERLARQKGVVRKLVAAEALGSTTLVLTDKTGTLTEAKMELSEIIGEDNKEELLRLALLTVEAAIENPTSDQDEWRIIGRPLEASIIRAAGQYKLFSSEILKKTEVLERHPFNSTDKFAAVHIKDGAKEMWVYLGAPSVLIDKSKIGKKEKDEINNKVDNLAYSGFRVLGISTDKEFKGLLAFNDPVREGVGEVIKEVEEAGVRTVIATGDHKGTALHVAKELGMKVTAENVMTGDEMAKFSDIELKKIIPKILIFARVTPEDKARLAVLYKELGEIVAVTGDGVNDAPALESADVGISIGSGTDIAKDSSDLVILDDNFKTIVGAISEGRRIMANVKKILVYFLSDALDELFLIGGALAFGMPLPINALQILWVNFFNDSMPSVALAFEKEPDGLKFKNSKRGRGLIDSEMKFLILVIGVLSSALLFGLYYYLINSGYNGDVVRTFIFASFSVYTLFLAFSVKSLRSSIFKYNLFDNKYLIISALAGFTLTAVAIYVPYFQNLLGTVSLSLIWAVGVVGVGILNIIGVEFGKYLFIRKSD